MFCYYCFLGHASFLQMGPRFMGILSTKVGVEMDFPLARSLERKLCRGKKPAHALKDGLARETHTVARQGLLVCCF